MRELLPPRYATASRRLAQILRCAKNSLLKDDNQTAPDPQVCFPLLGGPVLC